MNKIESRHRLIRSIISEKKIRTQQELQDSLEAKRHHRDPVNPLKRCQNP